MADRQETQRWIDHDEEVIVVAYSDGSFDYLPWGGYDDEFEAIEPGE